MTFTIVVYREPVPVDNYCERVGPGLWAEPLNAITNAAFLIASAVLLWQLTRAPQRPPASAWILPGLLGVVGLCSLSFHTFATEFTGALDTLSILVFILTAVVLIVRSGWNLPWRWAWLAAPAYLVAAFALNALLLAIGGERATLGGYIPAFVGLAGFGLVLRARELTLAAAVFAVSLTLRTLDDPLCGGFPAGTHFLWHCLNAFVLYLVSRYVIGKLTAALRDSPGSGRP